MPTIDDFVNNRWADAREALRKVDPHYVDHYENTAGLQRIGLEPPWSVNPHSQPLLRLPEEWHLYLESCTELVMQLIAVEAVNLGITDERLPLVTDLASAMGLDNRLRTSCINTFNLGERAQDVICKTVNLYMTNVSEHSSIAGLYNAKVDKLVLKQIKPYRDEYAHGNKRSWAKRISVGQLWEHLVSTQNALQTAQHEYFLPLLWTKTDPFKLNSLVPVLTATPERVGTILHELEDDLIDNYELKYYMGRLGQGAKR